MVRVRSAGTGIDAASAHRRLQQTKITQPSHFMIGSLDPMTCSSRSPANWNGRTQPASNVVLEVPATGFPSTAKEVNAACSHSSSARERTRPR